MGRYPIIRRAILRLAKKAVTETKTARKGVRKSGFRTITSGATGAGGTPVLILPPCAYTEAGVETPPTGFLAKYVDQDTSSTALNPSVVVIAQDGTPWVFGRQAFGQFGLGHTSTVGWTAVSGLPPIAKVRYNQGHIYYITEDGAVYATGRNFGGELGTGGFDEEYTPVLLDIPATVTDVRGTNQSAFHALTSTGEVYSWGVGDMGRLGDGYGPNDGRMLMEPFLNTDLGDDVEQIACGTEFTLLRRTDGSVDGFGPIDASGWPYFDPSVYVTYSSVIDPTTLPLSNPDCVDISAGGYSAMYVFGDGSVQISDRNDHGYIEWEDATPQLADFHNDPLDPDIQTGYGDVLILGGGSPVHGWTRENGAGFALLMDDGSLLSFGRNDKYDLGDGTDTVTDEVAFAPMYKAGTTLLAEDVISYTGVFGSGEYYAALSDGTLLYWKNVLNPAPINSEIV